VLVEIRKHDWHLAIDFTTDYHLLPAFLAAQSRARIRLGFENAGRERFFDIVLPFHERVHMMEQFRTPLEILGHESRGTFPPLDIPVFPLPFPATNGFRRRIGLHPGATHWTQRWPLAYFADLARALHDAGDQVVVLGVESERLMLEEIAERSRGAAVPIVCSGDVLQFAATLKALDLLVCNNSGPLHLAGLLGVPTISFMGPTVKERWWPLGDRARVLRRDSLPCIGCNLSYCKIRTHACMTELTPGMAFAEYLQFSADSPDD
jgi:ADP-heptose:LPS heptosyltransferase